MNWRSFLFLILVFTSIPKKTNTILIDPCATPTIVYPIIASVLVRSGLSGALFIALRRFCRLPNRVPKIATAVFALIQLMYVAHEGYAWYSYVPPYPCLPFIPKFICDFLMSFNRGLVS